MDRPVCEAMYEVSELAGVLGVKDLMHKPGCWEFQVDDQWWFAVNGSKEQRETSQGDKVPPFSCFVTFNGWPAGIIDPFGGVIAAGEAANEDTFIAAIKKARERAEARR